MVPTCESSHSITYSHENTGVSRSYVKMVYIKSRYSKSRAAHSNYQASHSRSFISSKCNSDQKQSLSTKSSTIENFSHICCGQYLTLPQKICQLTSKRHNDGHDQVRQGCYGGAFSNIHVVNFLEIFWLSDEQQIKSPRSGKIGINDGPDWHTSEH